MKLPLPDVARLFGLVLLAGCAAQPGASSVRLVGLASLPAATFAAGPRSGKALGPGPIHGAQLPLESQPVQGVSGLFDAGDGRIGAVLDNGFGTRSNSADFLLRLVHLLPDFRTNQGGSGAIRFLDFIQLRDPFGHLPSSIVHEGTEERLLTGADLDPESIQQVSDGSFWVGDEFGPYLLHFHPNGTLLAPPIPLEDPSGPGRLQAAESSGSQPARVRPSGGFEGLALTPDGGRLLALLEKPLTGEAEDELWLFEFHVGREEYTGTYWRYPLEPEGTAIGDFQMVTDTRGYVLERDSKEGPDAQFKALFEIRLAGPRRRVEKRLLANLLAIPDPDGLSLGSPENQGASNLGQTGDFGLGDPYAMPFLTIEGLLVLDDGRVLIANDNNYPFSVGRHVGPGSPDDTEFVLLSWED